VRGGKNAEFFNVKPLDTEGNIRVKEQGNDRVCVVYIHRYFGAGKRNFGDKLEMFPVTNGVRSGSHIL
jgi:hypothetical protein